MGRSVAAVARRLADRAAAVNRLQWLAELSRVVGYAEGMRIAAALRHAGDLRVKTLAFAVALFVFCYAALLAVQAAIESAKLPPPAPAPRKKNLARVELAPRCLPVPVPCVA